MTRTESTMNKYSKELEKLNAQLERAETTLEKKLQTAQKLGVAEWDITQYNEWRESVETVNNFIVNKQDVKKNGAWFDLYCAKERIKEIKGSIERTTRNLNKYNAMYEAELETIAITDAENQRSEIADRYLTVKLSEEEIKAMQEQMREEWRRDGIEITEFRGNSIAGITPNGAEFHFILNSGITDRSFHCYTLYIKGFGVIFTSGTIASCYKAIKRN